MQDLRLDEQGLRILTAEISNYKNISHKEIDFGGRSAIIVGQNGAGKSALLSALMSPIDSKVIPPRPVKDGEEKAEVEIELGGILNGEEVRYTLTAYFSQSNQKGRIVVSDENGKIDGGKAIIDSLVGNIGFDIFDFINKAKTSTGRVSEAGIREQIEILTSLMPQAGVDQLNKLDLEYETKYKERTTVNSEVSRLTEVVKHDFSPEEIELYEKPKSDSEVKEKINQVVELSEKWVANKNKITQNEKDLESLPTEIEKLEEMLAEKKLKLEAAKAFKIKGDAWLTKNPEKPSVDTLSKELEAIQEHNKKHLRVKELLDTQKTLREKKEEAEKLSERLDQIKKDKKNVFSSHPLPVKDLEFDDSLITYKGLPLHDEQINTSTLISIGMEIGMAMNPNLRVMIIRHGGLLDDTTMKHVLDAAEQKGYQLFIEKVVSGQENADIEFVEREIK